MKILVSTKLTQGIRKNDFCEIHEGEIVTFGALCDNDIDASCGCGRSMVGVISGRRTTTMKVVEKPDLTVEQLKAIIRQYLKKEGWLTKVSAEDVEKRVNDEALEISSVAENFSVGEIVEVRGDIVQNRDLSSVETDLEILLKEKIRIRSRKTHKQGEVVCLFIKGPDGTRPFYGYAEVTEKGWGWFTIQRIQ